MAPALGLILLSVASQAPSDAAHDAHADVASNGPTDVASVAPSSPSSAPLRLSDVLTEVEAMSPVIGASKARADALSRSADASGFWDEPFLAVGPDDPLPGLASGSVPR
jgi:hypothetical protein